MHDKYNIKHAYSWYITSHFILPITSVFELQLNLVRNCLHKKFNNFILLNIFCTNSDNS